MADNPKVLELRSRIGEIETELRAIHETAGDNAFTDEQQSQWDTLSEQRAAVTKEHADLEARLARVASFAANPEQRESGDGATGAPQSPEFMRQVDPFDGRDARTLTKIEARDKALKVVDGTEHTRHLSDAQREKAYQVLRTSTGDCDGSFVGRLMLLTENDDYRSAFVKLVTQPQPVLTAEEARAVNAVAEFRAMSGGTDSAGGFGVPVLIDPSIILTAQGSLNPFRRLARVETVTTDAWRGVSSAGVSWSYGAEASTAGDNSPTLAQPVVNVHEAKGFIPYSIRVGMDYPNFASEMSTLLMSGYDELQAQKFAVGAGDGSDEPFGIITALDANTNVEVSVTTDGAFGGADINKAWGALPDRYKANATWVMNYDVANEVASFGNGNNLSFVTVDLTGQIETLRTRPVDFSSYFPDFTGTTGAANVLVVGDWRNYLIADRVGMSVELVPHLFDVTNNRPTGQRGWFAYARNGADSINDLGFRLLQNT
jgi:HK97 family phage major capsid protein